MRVGIDLSPLRRESSGGIVQLMEGLCPALFERAPDVRFVVYQSRGGSCLSDALPRNAATVKMPGLPDAAELDDALASDGVDVLFRPFPVPDDLAFPLSRQAILLPDMQHEDCPGFFARAERSDRSRA